MQPFIDFLNHGYMPFVGRDEELDRLRSFCRAAVDGYHLRLASVIGEAGSGKSRLLDEFVSTVADDSFILIRAKFYPESTRSLAPIIAQELQYNDTLRKLLQGDRGDSVGEVTASLRRLCHLRPTILLLEDIHLLDGASVRELAKILDTLADEPLSVVCASRPFSSEIGGVLGKFVVEEMALGGLTADNIGELWRTLFVDTPDEVAIRSIREITLGNALALRSVLRGSLQSGIIIRSPEGRWKLTVSSEAFIQSVRNNADMLVQGMAAHLDNEERSAAERLSCLGERFSTEAARMLLGDATDTMLSTLVFRGVLHPGLIPIAPLPGTANSASPPFTFTHTLFHKHLAERSAVSANELCAVIASGAALFSVLPFQCIGESIPDVSLGEEELSNAIMQCLRIVRLVDDTSDWELAMTVLRIAEQLFEHCKSLPESITITELEAWIWFTKAKTMVRQDHTDEFEGMTHKLTSLAEKLDRNGKPLLKLSAFNYRTIVAWRRHPEDLTSVWNEVCNHLERNPDLHKTDTFIALAANAANAALNIGNPSVASQVQERCEALLRDPELDQEYREQLMVRVCSMFLFLFKTPEEFNHQCLMLENMSSLRGGKLMRIAPVRCAFLRHIGQYREAYKSAGEYVPKLMEQGTERSAVSCQIDQVCALAAFGVPLGTVQQQAIAVCSRPDQQLGQAMLDGAAPQLYVVGFFYDDIDWSERNYGTAVRKRNDIPPALLALHALHNGVPVMLETEDPDEMETCERLNKIIGYCLDTSTRSDALEAAQQLFAMPLLHELDLLTCEAVIRLLEFAERKHQCGIVDEVRNIVHDTVVRILKWFADHQANGYLSATVGKFSAYLDPKEANKWNARAEEIARENTVYLERVSGGGTRKMRISMLGSIRVTDLDGTEFPLRGERMRTMLGLLVADNLLRSPLATREFYTLATGNNDDPERARKTTNMGVLRLREAIGYDCVLTDGETPKLNLDVVSVDLLDIEQLLSDISRARRERRFGKALPMLNQALDMLHGAVPFPTLYDSFFEALREDFESRMRSTVIDVVSGLLQEGDASGAETVLRRLYEATPDDEEIAELFAQALIRLDRRVEAERIRMRTELLNES